MLTIEQEMALLKAENARLKLENQANAIANVNISSNTNVVAFKPAMPKRFSTKVMLKDGTSMTLTYTKQGEGGARLSQFSEEGLSLAEYHMLRKDKRFKINNAVKRSDKKWNVKFSMYL